CSFSCLPWTLSSLSVSIRGSLRARRPRSQGRRRSQGEASPNGCYPAPLAAWKRQDH
ncbi:MAG: hypothetical protein, partial [Olavius algarvensis Gamma 1 endosymbiont]